MCAYVHMYMCSWGVELEIPVVMLGAGKGIKIAPSGILCKYSVYWIFYLRIHMYNIIDGIVLIPSNYFFKKGTNFNTF